MKKERNPRAKLQLLILHQHNLGKSTKDIAILLCVHPATVRRTKERFLANGLSGIYDKHRRGRNSKLAPEDVESFKADIVEAQEALPGGRLTAKDIQLIAKEKYNAAYTTNGIYELLKRIGMSWV